MFDEFQDRIEATLDFVVRLVMLLVTSGSFAQEASPDGAGTAGAEDPFREQTIYIPYSKLRKTFEAEGRGVFLPYEKFRQLWEAARETTAPEEVEKPPLGALITEVENQAEVSQDVIQVTAVVRIQLLSEGWTEVPLRLADAAITEATLDGQPARILSGQGGYRLLVQKQSESPDQVELNLRYAKSITRAPGENSVSFQAPQAPVSRWRVRIPESGVKVNMDPLIAATEVTEADETTDAAEAAAEQPEETILLAFVGAAPTVRISWTPKAEGATGLEALASVQAQQQVTVTEGAIRTRTELAYTIRRAEMEQLAIRVPGHKVTGIFDANVRQWSVETADDEQTVTVQFFEPAQGAQNLVVELERFVGDGELQSPLAVPVVQAIGAGRQQGVVVVRVAEGLRAEASRTAGLMQIDAAELPESLRRVSWAYSYRYSTVPFQLELSVEQVQPRVLVDTLVSTELRPEELISRTFSVYTIERAGLFRLEVDVPAGYDVRRVDGHAAADATAAQVDSFHVENQTRLVVNLARKAMGRVGLRMEFRRELDEPDLLKPTGQAAAIPLEIPRVAAGTVERATGRVIFLAPPSLRVNPVTAGDMRSISFSEALKGMEGATGAQSSDVTPVLAYAFVQGPATVELAAERRKPQVTIRQLLVARVEEGAVNYQSTFFYEVLYSGVDALRIDIPASVSSKVHTKTEGLRDEILELPPDDADEGYIAWSFSAENEFLGQGQFQLAWEEELQQLETFNVPRLVPRQVDRAWGQIVLVKAETIDLSTSGQPTGLRPIDPQHDLMAGADVPEAAAALEFQADWELTIAATRYELEEIKHTSIERAVVRMVVTRADQITVQGLYRMRSARQRLVFELPASAAIDADPKLDGDPVRIETEGGRFYVPLVATNPDESFLLELRYTVPGDGSRLDLPHFPDEPAVQQVYLCAYLPKERTLIGKQGPWTELFGWQLGPRLRWEPYNRLGDSRIVEWVSDSASQADAFPTDGRLYVFSTLRPAPAPAGSLHLTAASENLLSFLALGLVLVGGVVLLPARASLRAVVLGVLVIALLFVSVFLPIRAWQIVDGAFVAAVAIVLVAWLVVFLVRTRPWSGRSVPAGPAEPTTGPEAQNGAPVAELVGADEPEASRPPFVAEADKPPSDPGSPASEKPEVRQAFQPDQEGGPENEDSPPAQPDDSPESEGDRGEGGRIDG